MDFQPSGRLFIMLKIAGAVLLAGIVLSYLLDYLSSTKEEEVKFTLPNTNWSPLISDKYDTTIKPFEINVSKEVLDDLQTHLRRKRHFVPSLEQSDWEYGVPGEYIGTVIEYWKTKYDWSKRQALLNKYPQFVTNIQGLNIHFYHVKPNLKNGPNLKVIPLILVHGWPGSVVEFQKAIPLLTTPRDNHDFVFEVIVPSLPGYGFSDAAARPGLGAAQIGVIFNNLMRRLGFEQYYTQGGDWGSAITAAMAVLFPERVLGSHSNFCLESPGNSIFWQLLGVYFPSLVVDSDHVSKVYPLSKHLAFLIRESGYMHLQATKPDTIGNALSESPVALAIYILEKFSTWTNPKYINRRDGGLLEKFTMDELLDNIMVYWVTNSITTSMRLYAESFTSDYRAVGFDTMPINIPTACASFPNEVSYTPESFLKSRYKNLVHYNHFTRGGHFAALEEPVVLTRDIWDFVKKVENH